MSRKFLLLVLVCVNTIAGAAQSDASTDQSAAVKALMQEVNELKTRLAVLEARQNQINGTHVPLASTAEPTPTPAEQQKTAGPEDVPPNVLETFVRGIKFQGFGEIGYRVSDIPSPEGGTFGFTHDSSPNFSVGDFDLFLTSRINDKASVLAEMVIGQEVDQTFNLDMERLLLKYDFNDRLKMSFGRFHTATSYYNAVFHSGKWAQTTVDRPFVVEFANDGGMLPTQAVGVSVDGGLPSGKLGAGYYVEYGTAHVIRPNLSTAASDVINEQNGNGITLGAYIRPDWFPGMQIGGSIYHDRLNPVGLGSSIGQTIGSVHAVYVTPKFEFMNEAFFISHVVNSTHQTFDTTAGYSQVSDNIVGHLRPYFRYDYANAPIGDPIFPDVGLRHGPTTGARYDFNSYIALKMEYSRTYRRQLPAFNRGATQLAFRF